MMEKTLALPSPPGRAVSDELHSCPFSTARPGSGKDVEMPQYLRYSNTCLELLNPWFTTVLLHLNLCPYLSKDGGKLTIHTLRASEGYF